MKNFKLFLLLAALFCGCATFVSCSDDDNGSNNGNGDTSLVGTWKHTFSSGYILLKFNSNGTGLWHEYDEADGGWYDPIYFNYSYNSATNRATLTASGERTVFQIAYLTSSEMVWYDIDYPDETENWVRID